MTPMNNGPAGPLQDFDAGGKHPAEALPPFPKAVAVAGLVWIVFGGLEVVGRLVQFLRGFVTAPVEAQDLSVLWAFCSGVVWIAFLVIGVQGLRGTAASVTGNGIASLLVGFPLFLLGISLWVRQEWLSGGRWLAPGVALLLAGILALFFSRDYQQWRASRAGPPGGPLRSG